MSDIHALENDLDKFARSAVPFANRSALNQLAFDARTKSQENIREDMITRNRFTENSVRVNMARGLKISQQFAVVGSIADYLEDQEFGAVKRKKGKVGTPIATSYSAGQGKAKPRTRLPRKPNRLGVVEVNKKSNKGTTRRQRNLIAVKEAAKSGDKFLFMQLANGRKGIFKVIGSEDNPTVKMIHDLTRDSVNIKANPWLKPAVDEVSQSAWAVYKGALEFQARRHGLFQ